MPLAFNSTSHGTVAFGFFNIESDMLLLDRLFFFSTDFCDRISSAALQKENDRHDVILPVYRIDDPEAVGNLMEAIHGIRYSGFIGDLYRKYPFPSDPEEFRQNPEGTISRPFVEETIFRYGQIGEISVVFDEGLSEIEIGEYRFNRNEFHELIRYVCRGGYPRWKDERKPNYVVQMIKKLSQSTNDLFSGIL